MIHIKYRKNPKNFFILLPGVDMIINIKTNMIQIEKSFLGLQKNSGQGRYKAGISTICMPSINVFLL